MADLEQSGWNDEEAAKELAIQEWQQTEELLNSYARLDRLRLELDQRKDELIHHRSEQPVVSAKIIFPEETVGARYRYSGGEYQEYAGPLPAEFRATGRGLRATGEIEFYNEYESVVIQSMPEGLRIVPIEPE